MTAPAVPPLAEFLRWLADMPEIFAAEPLGFAKGEVPVPAVVADLFDSYFGQPPAESLLAAFRPGSTSKAERNRLRWVLAACHLLWHPALRGGGAAVEPFCRLLIQDLATLAAVVPA